jgi:hypothetical protein
MWRGLPPSFITQVGEKRDHSGVELALISKRWSEDRVHDRLHELLTKHDKGPDEFPV